MPPRPASRAQRSLGTEPWPDTGPLRVRMGIHCGEADQRGGDYFGPTVNRTARIMAAGHGGQVLLSASAGALATERLPAGAGLLDLGEHHLKDLGRPEHLYPARAPGPALAVPAAGHLASRWPRPPRPGGGPDRPARGDRHDLGPPRRRIGPVADAAGPGRHRQDDPRDPRGVHRRAQVRGRRRVRGPRQRPRHPRGPGRDRPSRRARRDHRPPPRGRARRPPPRRDGCCSSSTTWSR